MTTNEITDQLEAIVFGDNFESLSYDLAEKWSSSGVGREAVEPILQFIERHPEIDYGSPGPLVHLIERPDLMAVMEYGALVVESVKRKPTSHTVWLLNRLVNGAKEREQKDLYLAVMADASRNPLADSSALESIEGFIKYQESKKS